MEDLRSKSTFTTIFQIVYITKFRKEFVYHQDTKWLVYHHDEVVYKAFNQINIFIIMKGYLCAKQT